MASLIKFRVNLLISFVAISMLSAAAIRADQDPQKTRQQEIVDEAQNLITDTPTGFTYLVKSSVNNLKSLASIAVHSAMHPIDTTINVTSSVAGKTRDVVSGGIKKGLYVASHPLAIPKRIVSAIRHPLNEAKNFIMFCDAIDINNVPVIGRINEAMKQFGGLIPITAENCPELYTMLQEVAKKVGVEVPHIYIFKGNYLCNLLESLGIIDFSCNAFQSGFTAGTSIIAIGKDLLIGVNQGQDSFVAGMTPEELEAVFAHEAAHRKNRHVLKLCALTAASVALLTYVQYLIFTKSVIPNGNDVVRINALGRDTLFTANFLIYRLLEKYAFPLVMAAYSRKCEKEADTDGSCAVDSPVELSEALSKLVVLYTTKHRALAQLFESHPDIGARKDYLQKLDTARKQTSK